MNAVVRRACLAAALVSLATPALAEDAPNTGGVESTAAFERADGSEPANSEGSFTPQAPPEYPPTALRRCEGGVVVLKVEFDANGAVRDIRIQQSSGYRSLDRTAVKTTIGRRFNPGMKDGQPSGGVVVVTTTFDPHC